MRILITGGLGQIGSHVADLCLDRGDEVVVIDNLATGRIEHLNPQKNLEIVIDTIANKDLIFSIFEKFKPEAVVHTAASYKDPDDWYNDTMTNCVGAANVIQAAKKNQCKRFIYYQTALCYGLKPLHQPINLSHPILPGSSSYSISKTANEYYLDLSGLEFVTFRLANVIGPRNVAGPLPIFYQRLKEKKKCFVTKAKRDFVYVGDLALVTLKAIDGLGNGAYHFSSGTDVSIQTLYNYVVESMNLDYVPELEIKELNEDDVASILLDPKKTFEDFGEIEFTPLEVTVKKAIEYYMQHGTLGEYTHLRIEKKGNSKQ